MAYRVLWCIGCGAESGIEDVPFSPNPYSNEAHCRVCFTKSFKVIERIDKI